MPTKYVFGRLTSPQREALRPIVKDRIVHDLGAGLCSISVELATMGARKVVAVDCETPPPTVLNQLPSAVSFQRVPFERFRPKVPPTVAMLSWPSLGLDYGKQGVLRLVREAPVVAYLGINRATLGESLACGGRPLWEHFEERELLAYVPGRKNNLLVLGRWRKGSNLRPLTQEEKDARWQHFDLDEAMAVDP